MAASTALALALSRVISVTGPARLTCTVVPIGEFPGVQMIGQPRSLHADNDAPRVLAPIQACPLFRRRALAFLGKSALHCITSGL